jgi:hypothetical protein
MKASSLGLLFLATACGASPALEIRATDSRSPEQPPATKAAVHVEKLAADTPRTTVKGASFVAPGGWSIAVKGPATILEAPEADSWIALVDVEAKDADAAVAAAWAAYKPDAKWPLKSSTAKADKDGWTDQRTYDYQTSPNERREVEAFAKRGGGQWTVLIYDVSEPTGQKRLGQVSVIFGRLFPKGYKRESFAGRKETCSTRSASRSSERSSSARRRPSAYPGSPSGSCRTERRCSPAASA